MYLYLILNLATISIPLALIFDKKVNFYKKLRYYLPATLITSLFFLIWDIIFAHHGLWHFNPDYITGLYVFNLPIEEILFFYTVPYACVFLYETFICYGFVTKSKLFVIITTVFLLALSLLFAIIFYNRIYTCIISILLAVSVIYFAVIKNYGFLGYFYLTLYICLIPFTIVNGMLTGSFFENEVVSYNISAISNIRFLKIPIEDFLYYFELFLLNVGLFEIFRKKHL